jgi:hypothetical protein
MAAAPPELPQTHSEVVAMALLSELQPALAVALNSLGGRMTKGVEDLYYLYASSHINTALDAFVLLRREHRIDGARLLVRPALETMLRLQAVRAKPYLLYRVFFAKPSKLTNGLGVSQDATGSPTRVFVTAVNGTHSGVGVPPSLALIS